MAAPQGGYPPQEGYDQAPGYGSPAGAAPQHQAGGRKKQRAYAGEAFEFGQGANAALGGQQKGGGDYAAFAAQAAAAGYPQPGYPQPGGVGDYQPPAAGYPAPSAAGVAQVTQQFGQLGVSDPHQVQQPQQRALPLNQLYPTDLLAQPFNVAELDYPPPPIILPPNVRGGPKQAHCSQDTDLGAGDHLPVSLCQLPSEIC